MTIAVVREIKPSELRVALTPGGALDLIRAGHRVLVESGAGVGSGYPDESYASVGAEIARNASEAWEAADLVVKVKEPMPSEYAFFRPDLVLFTYLHLAASLDLAKALAESGINAIAYETVETDDGNLPLLAPMSAVAGRLAGQVAAFYLQHPAGGTGTLMGGVPGVAPAEVLVIGGGVVGTHAARMAVGLGAHVTILERSIERACILEELFGNRARVLIADELILADNLAAADAVIGAVLVPGARAPKVVSQEMLATRMKPRSVAVDVAIDQGGCFETSRPTTHEDPTYKLDGVLHYCVTNMPAAVPSTSTRALTNATLPYLKRLADAERGWRGALESDPVLARGLNAAEGKLLGPVAELLG